MSQPIDAGGAPPGAQHERTTMAWTRTSLALLANGVLVLIRHESAFPIAVSAVLAGVCFALAMLSVGYSVWRIRQVNVAADRIVLVLSAGMVVLCVATGIALVFAV